MSDDRRRPAQYESDTGVEAAIADGPCPHCARTTPRVVPGVIPGGQQ
ncbi:MAG: hypothetical protein U5K30_08715 [Acidimicrobiales bacterium]|nr:hypothetical protein [Acidimicrobiales bacterium]